MRIPSALTEDNLYRRQRVSELKLRPYRRLFRLGLAVILVILVMREAGDPAFYRVFLPPDGPVGQLSPAPTTRVSVAADPSRPEATTISESNERVSAVDQALRDRLRYVVDSLTDEDAMRMMGLLSDPRTAMPPAAPDERTVEVAASLERDAEWLRGWVADAGDPAVAQGLQRELDLWAIRRVDAAAVWKGVDSAAFYRFLNPAAIEAWRDQPATQASIISLIQQPEIYLKQRVLLRGSVARAIRRTAKTNPFGIDEYWELWLRPTDASERPWVLFTASVPPTVAAIPADQTVDEGPSVWAEGMYLKRIAYRSATGRELAPAIVGILQMTERSDPVQRGTPAAPAERREGWWLVGAVLAGLSVAALLFIPSYRSARRSAAVRRATSPDASPFLDSLSAHASQPSPLEPQPSTPANGPTSRPTDRAELNPHD
jgi:hypothetical protein